MTAEPNTSDLPPPPRADGGIGLSRGLIILLGTLTATSPLSIDMYLPAFPRIEKDLSAPPGTMQYTLSMFLAGLAMGHLFWGPVSDRLGRRLPLMIGSLGFASSALLCMSATSIHFLIGARFLTGLCGSSGVVISRAVVRDRCDTAGSARVYSMMMLVLGVAPVLAPALGSALLIHAHWRAIFVLHACVGVATSVAVALALPETLAQTHRARGHVGDVLRGYLGMLTHRRFVGYAISAGFGSGLLFAYISGSPFVFMQLHGISPDRFPIYFSCIAIGLFGLAQFNRMLLRKTSPHSLLIGAYSVNAAAGLLMVGAAHFQLGFGVFYAALLVCIGTLGLIFPNASAAAMAPYAKQAGSASALLGMLQYALGAAAGGAIGLLFNHTAMPMAGTMAACGASGLIVLLINREAK